MVNVVKSWGKAKGFYKGNLLQHERKAKKEQVIQFAKIMKSDKDELLTLLLTDKIYDVIKDEDVTTKAMDCPRRIKNKKETNQK